MEIRADAETSSFSSLFAAVAYGFASMAMVFINKAVLMQYAYSMTLLTLQQLATSLLIHVGRRAGFTKARGLEMTTAKRLLPLSIFYNANVAFALASLKGVNIPMYIAIKRLTPLAVLIAGYFSGKGRPTSQVALSVILIAAGVLIAALGDFSFDLFGYSMAFVSVFFQSYSFSFLMVLILSLVMGIVLNFTMFLCTIVNSALTTTIVGVLKGVVSTTLGFFLLGGVQVHALNVSGLVINTAGGVWYSFAKYQQKRSKSTKLVPDEEAHRK
ncbi:UDP-galactose/UDP-glucose transporter 7 isoform X2 [Vigna angularis]|uniref:UDP-galactose/UDP-glucose transporter 7 isoform X2 n=1 Tax=Phaseolus angularis TaxID=3914 RepID=UPI000809C079|nr:UDP-galactose/UDP-glucose transporter 7 isoform X2 [Vigna angularis]